MRLAHDVQFSKFKRIIFSYTFINRCMKLKMEIKNPFKLIST